MSKVLSEFLYYHEDNPSIDIYLGDNAEILPLLQGGVDMILTDPPYGINYQSNMRVVSKQFDRIENDNNDSRFLLYPQMHKVLKEDCVLIAFCSFKNYSDDYKEIEKHFDIKNCIIWFKGGGGIGDLSHSLSTDYEMAIVGHKGQCTLKGKRHGSVWKSNKVNPSDMRHPTEKPIDILEKMIDSFTNSNALILDPYLGCGSTLLACKELKRSGIGIEISEKYCEIARKRLVNTQVPFL